MNGNKTSENTSRKGKVQTATFSKILSHTILRLKRSIWPYSPGWSLPLWCVCTQCCALPLLPTRQASYFSSRSPCVATCFVAVQFLNWNFCRTADWELDSVSAFFSFAWVHLVTNYINTPRFRLDSAEVWLLSCVHRKQRLKRNITLPKKSKSYRMHSSVHRI